MLGRMKCGFSCSMKEMVLSIQSREGKSKGMRSNSDWLCKINIRGDV
jgi:hypothetical protein